MPEDYGFTTCELDELIGGSPVENAEITLLHLANLGACGADSQIGAGPG